MSKATGRFALRGVWLIATLLVSLFVLTRASSAQSQRAVRPVLFGANVSALTSWSGKAQGMFFPAIVREPDLVLHTALSFDELGSGSGFSTGLSADIPLGESFDLQLVTSLTRASLSRTENDWPLSIGDSAHPQFTNVTNSYTARFTFIGLEAYLVTPLARQSLFLKAGLAGLGLSFNSFTGSQQVNDPTIFPYVDERTNVTSTKNALLIRETQLSDFFNSYRVDFRVGVEGRVELSSRLFLDPQVAVSMPMTTLFNSAREKEYKELGATTPRLWFLTYGLGIKLAIE